MSCSKQYHHLYTPNNVRYAPKVSYEAERFQEIVSECANHKRRQFDLLFDIFLWSDLPSHGISVFSPAPPLLHSNHKVLQHLSGAIHDSSCAQVWYQSNCSPLVKMAVSHIRFTYSFSQLLTFVKCLYHFSPPTLRPYFLHSFQCILMATLPWRIICTLLLHQLNTTTDNLWHTLNNFPTQPTQWWISCFKIVSDWICS